MKIFIRFLIGILMCISLNKPLQAAFCNENNTCQEDDYIALRALYLGTDGDNWTNNTGWYNADFFNNHPTLPAGTDMSTWYGVGLNDNACVTCLDMRATSTCTDGYDTSILGNNMTGNLPPEIGNLNALTKLYLHNNDIGGNIPPQLGNLANLEELHLSGNEFTGEIPEELGNFPQLIYLDLGRNELSGTLSNVVNLEELVTLDLRSNNFSGSIPAELGSLDSLRFISLMDNQLTGTIPSELGNLDLIVLWLNHNELTGTIPSELGNATNLRELWLWYNELTGSIPSELGNLTDLRHLFLRSNQLTGFIPLELGNLSSLKSLSLSSNQLSGSIPPELGNLSSLEGLSLYNNQLIGNIPAEFADLTNLYSLALYDNRLRGCYYSELSILCDQLTATVNWEDGISNGNYFDVTWPSFCAEQLGMCETTDSSIPTQTDAIHVFPIPAKDYVYFEIDNLLTSTTVILYDVSGKKISTQPLSSDKRVNVSQLNRGVYFYELLHEGELYSGKITK